MRHPQATQQPQDKAKATTELQQQNPERQQQQFGAAKAVLNRKSLFAADIVSTSDSFRTQDAVKVLDMDDNEIARGLVNYNASDVEKLIGKVSQEYESAIGYHGPEEILYRYNID